MSLSGFKLGRKRKNKHKGRNLTAQPVVPSTVGGEAKVEEEVEQPDAIWGVKPKAKPAVVGLSQIEKKKAVVKDSAVERLKRETGRKELEAIRAKAAADANKPKPVVAPVQKKWGVGNWKARQTQTMTTRLDDERAFPTLGGAPKVAKEKKESIWTKPVVVEEPKEEEPAAEEAAPELPAAEEAATPTILPAAEPSAPVEKKKKKKNKFKKKKKKKAEAPEAPAESVDAAEATTEVAANPEAAAPEPIGPATTAAEPKKEKKKNKFKKKKKKKTESADTE